ncbi:MAG: chorismate mutase [Rubrobacter sp.]
MKSPEDCASIEDVRLGIDALDREIVTLIGRRARFVEAAAQFKTGEAAVRATERRKAMLETRRQWAEEEDLSPEVIEAVFETLVSYFVDREMDRWRNNASS